MVEVSEIPTKFARVGRRFHLVPGGLVAYDGQPQVALCGSVFINNPEDTAGLPSCTECTMLEVDRLRFIADQSNEQANDLAVALVKHFGGSSDER